MESNEKILKITISSAGTGKRILSFLADFFIAFIISCFVFQLVVFNISKASFNYEGLLDKSDEIYKTRLNLLIEKRVLIPPTLSEDKKEYSYDEAVENTFDVFLYYYAFKEDVEVSKDDDIVSYYWLNNENEEYRKEQSEINNIFIGSDPNQKYFENITDKNGRLVMTLHYKALFAPYFDENNELSSTGKDALIKFKNEFYVPLYGQIYTDLMAHNQKFIELDNKQIKNNNKINSVISGSASVSFFIVCICYYFVVPLCNKKRRTFAKMILKLEVVDEKSYKYLKIPMVVARSLIDILENLAFLIFVPFTAVNIAYCFSLDFIRIGNFAISNIIIMLVSLLFSLISLGICMLNQKRKSIKELSSSSIVILEKDLDNYYLEMGYGNK